MADYVKVEPASKEPCGATFFMRPDSCAYICTRPKGHDGGHGITLHELLVSEDIESRPPEEND